jgi:hypothetical protein
MVRRNRRNLPYRPIPTDLRRRRRIAPDYSNFYGSYITKTGKIKRFSFKVKVNPDKKNSAKYTLMRVTCQRILKNKIPPVPNGFVFDDFGDLLNVQDWIKVRKVRTYKAGMQYNR